MCDSAGVSDPNRANPFPFSLRCNALRVARSTLKLFEMKTIQPVFLAQAPASGIREAHKSNKLFSIGVNQGFSDRKPGARDRYAAPEAPIDQLTPRQREILRLIAEGKANKEAASELCISVKTVEKHRGSLMEKLGIHGTAGLTRFAIAAGVIECHL